HALRIGWRLPVGLVFGDIDFTAIRPQLAIPFFEITAPDDAALVSPNIVVVLVVGTVCRRIEEAALQASGVIQVQSLVGGQVYRRTDTSHIDLAVLQLRRARIVFGSYGLGIACLAAGAQSHSFADRSANVDHRIRLVAACSIRQGSTAQ